MEEILIVVDMQNDFINGSLEQKKHRQSYQTWQKR